MKVTATVPMPGVGCGVCGVGCVAWGVWRGVCGVGCVAWVCGVGCGV